MHILWTQERQRQGIQFYISDQLALVLWNASSARPSRTRVLQDLCLFNQLNYRHVTFLCKIQNHRGGSRIFFWRGCTCLLLYFNTNKPHRFFLQNTSCIRKPQVISEGGGGVRTPCTLPLDPPLNHHL